MALNPGDVISYLTVCNEEGGNLQKGMNFHPFRRSYSVLFMSVRKGAPYQDKLLEDGRVLIYEGHDQPRRAGGPDPKSVDQPLITTSGRQNENGKFFYAASEFKAGRQAPELVRVYEKIKDGIWVFSGFFHLVDAWQEKSGGRKVCKFRLEIQDMGEAVVAADSRSASMPAIEHTRMIPTTVKLEVWQRDKGQCQRCGTADNLHFDHLLPFSKGGTSLLAENIQLLCARHNLEKRDRIE
jgi:hypothetical protein